MQGYSHNKQNTTSFLFKLIRKLSLHILKSQSRPAELPPTAPDCGWNHGEEKEDKV
jgi:hypothetical protein